MAWPTVIASAGVLIGCAPALDVSFFVLVKSSNHAQDSTGALTLLNYHFFSEIVLKSGAEVRRASLSGPGERARLMSYEDRGDNFYVEGGHFDTLEDLDAAYPNGEFRFNILTELVDIDDQVLTLAGPDGQTDIPSPIVISLFQSGARVSPVAIDAAVDLVIRWSDYSNGAADPRGIVDDMIFVVVADCHGERIYHTGLPFEGGFLTFRATETVVEANAMHSGQPYSMFVEFPHVVDSRVIDGTPGFTSYATATYLDLRTAGAATGRSCPQVSPPMDTGQTDRPDEAGS